MTPLTPAEYLDLWRANQSAARTYAQKLGRDQLALAVALAALKQPSEPMSTYTSWLRVWRCPPVPADLVNLGWKWNADEELELTHGSATVTITASGKSAFTAARRLAVHLHGSYANLSTQKHARLKQAVLWEVDG